MMSVDLCFVEEISKFKLLFLAEDMLSFTTYIPAEVFENPQLSLSSLSIIIYVLAAKRVI